MKMLFWKKIQQLFVVVKMTGGKTKAKNGLHLLYNRK